MRKGHYLFTSESVSEGHPDKVADAISDAILDNILVQDKNARVACETMVTTGQVIIAGEVTTDAYVDIQKVARDTINKIGYTKSEYMFDGNSCGILSAIHSQSLDIAMGVDKEEQGAGDQGIMFGYATNETSSHIPMTLDIAHKILQRLSEFRKTLKLPYLRPDAKSQVTIEYDENDRPERLDTIVVSTQHDEDVSIDTIKEDLVKCIIAPIIKDYDIDTENFRLLVNPTGRFVVGGPHGDTGLTGRKIIVDTYGGWGAHGGGAFSGKDASKVDRSAAYAARHIATNLVGAGVCDRCLVQLSYAIGVAKPISICINTYNTNHTKYNDEYIADYIKRNIDLRPQSIISKLKLLSPIYSETTAYGHFGRTPQIVTKPIGDKTVVCELFTWEKLDYVDKFRKVFNV